MTGILRRQGPSFLFRIAAVALVVCAAGCSDDDQPPHKPSTQESSPTTEIDRIRSLGYAGYSSGKADPNKSGVVRHDRNRSCSGYNLYSNRDECAAYLIDATGRVIRSWRDQGGRHWANCELLPNGDLLVVGSDWIDTQVRLLVDETRYLLRLSWNSEVVWKRTMTVHHDVEVTAQDRILALTLRHRRVPEINPNIDIRDHLLTFLSPDGVVLEEYSLYDLLAAAPDVFAFQTVAPDVKRRTPRIDLFHSNSVETIRRSRPESKHPIHAPGNILVCIRHQDTVAVVDGDEKKLLWAWGQGRVSGPHDATMLDNGHILLFDNGLVRKWSRVIELDPLTEEIVWEYHAPDKEDFFTVTLGSCQRLWNGNTLIVDSEHGEAFEVTPDGTVVWRFFNPLVNEQGHRATIVRMKRYEPSYVRQILRNHSARGADPDS